MLYCGPLNRFLHLCCSSLLLRVYKYLGPTLIMSIIFLSRQLSSAVFLVTLVCWHYNYSYNSLWMGLYFTICNAYFDCFVATTRNIGGSYFYLIYFC